jgi:hypothetical protein
MIIKKEVVLMNEKIFRSRIIHTGVLFLLMTAFTIVLFTSNAAAASQVFGTVTDAETEKPIEGAKVYIYQSDSKENAVETRTNTKGYYEADIEPGTYSIYVSGEGYSASNMEVTVVDKYEHNVELAPGSDGKDDTGKDNYTKDDYNKDDYNKDDTTKDDTTKDDTTKSDADNKSGDSNSVPLVIAGAVIAVIAIVVGLFIGNKMGQKRSGTGTKKDNDWTTCPECGTDLMQKDLSSHIDSVHNKPSKSSKGKSTKKAPGESKRMKKGGGPVE